MISYPNAQTLRRFRREIGDAKHLEAHFHDDPTADASGLVPYVPDPFSIEERASAEELRHGIGAPFGHGDDRTIGRLAASAGEHFAVWLRGANIDRAGAFDRHGRMGDFASYGADGIGHPPEIQTHAGIIGVTRPGDQLYVAAWWTERQHGCPTWKEEDPA
jgi:hypothetical protein